MRGNGDSQYFHREYRSTRGIIVFIVVVVVLYLVHETIALSYTQEKGRDLSNVLF